MWAVFQLDGQVGPDEVGDTEIEGGGHAVVPVDKPRLTAVGADHDGERHAVAAYLLQQLRVVLGAPPVVEDVPAVQRVGGGVVVGGGQVEDVRAGDAAETAGDERKSEGWGK